MGETPMMVQLTPEETIQFRSLQEHVDGFVAGASALAEDLKRKQLNELVRSRPAPMPPAPEPPPVPEPPKENPDA